jgi:hypothetical protein
MVLAVALSGCASTPPRTTTLIQNDYDHISAEMAAKLRGSEFLASRGPDSPPMQVSIEKVQNLTSQIIPEADQWWFVHKLRAATPMNVLAEQKNIRFVMPPEQVARLRSRGDIDVRAPAERYPTHTMTATFRTTTRMSEQDRTELYMCSFSIIHIDTGELVWVDSVEFQRTAQGLMWD